MPSTGGSTGWPRWIAIFFAWPLKSFFTKKKHRRLSSSTKRLRSPGGSARRNRRNSSTACWTASRRNWIKRGVMDSFEQIRIQKMKEIQELGYDPYPTFYRNRSEEHTSELQSR